VLIRKALGLEKGSGVPNKEKVGTLSKEQLRSIAEAKLADLNANDIEMAMRIVAGTARSMGVLVEGGGGGCGKACGGARGGPAMKHGKKYLASAGKRTHSEQVSLEQAVALVKSMAFAKFDETVEVAIRLDLKGKHTVRDTLVLPHGFRAEKKILVFAKGDKAEEARANGAAFVGDQDLIEKIQGGWLDFDIAVATPDMMKDVGKLGQVLGRRGLMPNPKTKTVTFDVKGAVEELKKGRVEFKADKSGVVHMAIGKVA
jgi:large subunit ribosomal protein L1